MDYNGQLEVDLNSQLNLALKLRSQIYEAMEDLDQTIDPTGTSTLISDPTFGTLRNIYEQTAEVVVKSTDDASFSDEAVSTGIIKSKTDISLFPMASVESGRTTATNSSNVAVGYFSHGELLRKNVEA
mmetsp:Transcript_34059/g.75068  ORF Transcript_34059/g.75068 Transcript_34059/m.75068 type:complete len:128 (-) Transcript_34059:1492-1875(-)